MSPHGSTELKTMPLFQNIYSCMLQAGRLQVRLLMSLEFFIDTILPTTLWPWGRLSLKQK
jgi:hypothetical protein